MRSTKALGGISSEVGRGSPQLPRCKVAAMPDDDCYIASFDDVQFTLDVFFMISIDSRTSEAFLSLNC